jgi:serine/threonine protein kinase
VRHLILVPSLPMPPSLHSGCSHRGFEFGSHSSRIVKKAIRKAAHASIPEGEYALKIIDKDNVEDTTEILREIEIMSMLDVHPNLARLFEVFEEPTKVTLVLALLTGGDLFDRIEETGKFTEKDAALVLRQLCAALQHLHSWRAVHRDIKPDNLMLSSRSDVHVVLVDFGMARRCEGDGRMRTTCGTPIFIAPEICAGDLSGDGYEFCGGAVDQWSAGVMLYILLCGFPPFEHPDLATHYELVMKGEFEFKAPYFDHVSDDAKDLVSKLLERSPEQRWSAAQVLGAPWVSGGAGDTAVAEQALDELKRFNATRKLKKVGHRVMRLQKAGLLKAAIAAGACAGGNAQDGAT